MRVRYSFSSRHTGNLENIKKQKEKFPEMVKDMISICDIILEVLDARFIEETRNIFLEDYIKKNNKKIIYVLNKSDLIDIEDKKKQAKETGIYPFVFVSCKNRTGSRELRNRIKIEVKKMKLTYSRAQVGVIGYPNAGKSSLINFLTGKSSAKTASEAGFTKGIQRVKLASNILLLDTPGVIPDEDYSVIKEALAKHAKIGARTYDKVKDPEFIVYELFENHKKPIQNFYNIPDENVEEFLEELARQKGFLLKGNRIDLDRASRFVLKDWQKGNIRI